MGETRRGVREWKRERDLILRIAQAIYHGRLGFLTEEDKRSRNTEYEFAKFERLNPWLRAILTREAEAAFEVMRQEILREQIRDGSREAESVMRNAGHTIDRRISNARKSQTPDSKGEE